MDKEIQDCPFCGSKKVKGRTDMEDGCSSYMIECNDCEGNIFVDFKYLSDLPDEMGEEVSSDELSHNISVAEEECRKKWNRRSNG